jgi:hypothetical protein
LKTLIYLLNILLVCTGIGLASDVQYTFASSDRYSWRVDLVPAPCEDCPRLIRFDRNAVMYVLSDPLLYVLQPDGTAPTVFDLAMAKGFSGVPYDDMIPFEDGTVVFLTTPIIGAGLQSGRQIISYELEAQSAHMINKALGNDWDCGHTIRLFERGHFLERTGTETISLCNRDVIDILNVKTGIVEHDLEVSVPCGEAACRPWQQLVGGYERFYLYNSRFPQIAPLAYGYHLKRYEFETQEWTSILVPSEIFDRTPSNESMGTLRQYWPIDSDEEGNITFQVIFSLNEDHTQRTNLVKLDSTGQIIWSFTEADLPDEAVMFVGGDLFVGLETGQAFQITSILGATTSR